MDDKKSWCSSIVPPEVSSTTASDSYLDRMIGKGDRDLINFLPPKNNKFKKISKLDDRATKHVDKKRRPALHSGSLVTNIDDVSWLEDRRKRFPKLGEPAPSEVKTANGEAECPKSITQSGKKRPSMPESGAPKNRKKTLFERLTETD